MVIRRVIAQLAARGKAVFFSSPVLEQLDQLSTHLAVIKKGEVIACGSMDEMRAGFGGIGLEQGFMQLTEQVDADAIATGIVAAVAA